MFACFAAVLNEPSTIELPCAKRVRPPAALPSSKRMKTSADDDIIMTKELEKHHVG